MRKLNWISDSTIWLKWIYQVIRGVGLLRDFFAVKASFGRNLSVYGESSKEWSLFAGLLVLTEKNLLEFHW